MQEYELPEIATMQRNPSGPFVSNFYFFLFSFYSCSAFFKTKFCKIFSLFSASAKKWNSNCIYSNKEI